MNKSIRGRKAAPAQKADLYQQVTTKSLPPWKKGFHRGAGRGVLHRTYMAARYR